jgi:hypothetical protein
MLNHLAHQNLSYGAVLFQSAPEPNTMLIRDEGADLAARYY